MAHAAKTCTRVAGTLIIAKCTAITVFVSPCENTNALHRVVHELAFVQIAIWPLQLAIPLAYAGLKLASVDPSIYPAINTQAFGSIIGEFTLIAVTSGPDIRTRTVQRTINNLTNIAITISKRDLGAIDVIRPNKKTTEKSIVYEFPCCSADSCDLCCLVLSDKIAYFEAIFFISICLCLGLSSGFLGGLLGIGGGIVIVPVLAIYFSESGRHALDVVLLIAVATSLACIVFTSGSAAFTQARARRVNFTAVKRLLPSLVLGSFIAGYIAPMIPVNLLRIFFALFLLVVASIMFLQWQPSPNRQLPGAFAASALGSIAGLYQP